ncbi:uncharacterized protein CLUP02_10892 [Colletotrichum lupini]|uniref:Uncharacterized protein n=1 Tax=Colletotrichum lupini TaxID=145971 RepID=A0A9Q8SXT7_9PEZI|nr:uncharacterized protein CLUP02_10892 [Colletotrichum lupini]UQC85395.1 hypothetical protein CLUP02_10892 [Colletotrichum lupini]
MEEEVFALRHSTFSCIGEFISSSKPVISGSRSTMRNARSVERPTSPSGRHAWRHGQQCSLGSGVPINKVVVAEEATDFTHWSLALRAGQTLSVVPCGTIRLRYHPLGDNRKGDGNPNSFHVCAHARPPAPSLPLSCPPVPPLAPAYFGRRNSGQGYLMAYGSGLADWFSA